MRRLRTPIVLIVLVVAIIAIAAPRLLGFSLRSLPTALAVGSAMGAKIACSSHFLSGFTLEHAIEDLKSYSPVNALLDLRIEARRVTASLAGISPYAATYRPGLGCTLEIGDTGHLDELHATAVAPTEDVPVRTVAVVQGALDALLVQDSTAGLQTRALVIAHAGRIVAEAYAEPIGPHTPLLGYSMGKSVTAMLVGRMGAMGLLQAQADAPTNAPLFPAWADDVRAQIKLTHLLQMNSGLAFDETYAPGSDATRMLFLEHDTATLPLGRSLEHEPGRHFSYSSGSTNLIMAYLRERLGGSQALIDFFATAIRKPLGLDATLFEPDPGGLLVGSSWIYATGRDWARLGQFMLQDGRWRNQQLLPVGWVRAATTPNGSGNDQRYGYQFWLNAGGDVPRWATLPHDAFAMMGNRGQVVMVIPSADAVIVRLGWNAGPYPLEDTFPPLLRVLDALESEPAADSAT